MAAAAKKKRKKAPKSPKKSKRPKRPKKPPKRKKSKPPPSPQKSKAPKKAKSPPKSKRPKKSKKPPSPKKSKKSQRPLAPGAPGGPVALIIMDGWGIAPPGETNAIHLARTPVWDRLEREYPCTEISATGRDVGLPAGLMGNSEVGHLNLGSGRVVWQEITRIDRTIEDGSFFSNPALLAAVAGARASGGRLHLMGLLSDGGVHSAERHYFALLELARRAGLAGARVAFHCYLDGRDTPPNSGRGYVRALEAKMKELGVGRIATVIGRYWAMDRDKRWERVERAYRCLTAGAGRVCSSGAEAVETAYKLDQTDEFVEPVLVCPPGAEELLIRDGDAVLCFNFRGDRPREILHALTDAEFTHFTREVKPELAGYTTMTEYEKGLGDAVAFPPVGLRGILADVAAASSLRQFRTAETEKYAHVTFFFNGGVEAPWPGEERRLIPSPRVATYDLQPEMSAPKVARAAAAAIRSGKYGLVVMNFANGDMVGHTGVLESAVQAVEAVDAGLGVVLKALAAAGGEALVTADHGNAEQMWDAEHDLPHTAHTTNPVPLALFSARYKDRKLRGGRSTGSRPRAGSRGGRLADVAPTLLELLGLAPSEEMEGGSLVE